MSVAVIRRRGRGVAFRVLAFLALLGCADHGAAQTSGVIDLRVGRNAQGKTWTSGLTCPPVTTPLGGAGSLYTCATDGSIYTWDGAAWDAAGSGGGGPLSLPIDLGPFTVDADGVLNAARSIAPFEARIADFDAEDYTPVLAGAGAGNVSNGAHRYKFALGDYTEPTPRHTGSSGTPTPAVTVADNSVNGTVTVAIPFACNTHYPRVFVYRDKDSDGVYKLVGDSHWSCESTFEDDVADGSLGETMPADNTTLNGFRFADNGALSAYYDSNTWGWQMIELGETPGPWVDQFEFRGSDAKEPGNRGTALHFYGGSALSADGDLVQGARVSVWYGNGDAAAAGNGGPIELVGGNTDIAGKTGGSVSLTGGGNADGTGGNIYLTAGTGTTRGNVVLSGRDLLVSVFNDIVINDQRSSGDQRGVTDEGSSCVITRITLGYVTGATCTP